MVCVSPGEGVAVRSCRAGLQGIAETILFRSLYFNTVNAAPTFLHTDFLQRCGERDQMKKDNTVEVPLTSASGQAGVRTRLSSQSLSAALVLSGYTSYGSSFGAILEVLSLRTERGWVCIHRPGCVPTLATSL